MINDEYEFIFVRVAKTASTSILSRLPKSRIMQKNWKYDSNHIPLWHIKANLDKNICDAYFKFAFVRNPFARAVSTVKYWNKWSLDGGGPQYKFKNFFVGQIPEKVNSIDHNFLSKYGSQYDFTKGCDFIGKVENLQEDFNTICDKIGIPQQKLPHLNTTNHKHYTEYYDDETRQIVAEKYAKDIEYFGYKFGE